MLERRHVCINIESRDLGYGSECWYGVSGTFTGEVDTWSKHTFVPDDPQLHPFYLFTDEFEYADAP